MGFHILPLLIKCYLYLMHQLHVSFPKSLFSNKNLKLLQIFSSKDLGENWRPGGNWGKLKNFCHSCSNQKDVYLRRKP